MGVNIYKVSCGCPGSSIVRVGEFGDTGGDFGGCSLCGRTIRRGEYLGTERFGHEIPEMLAMADRQYGNKARREGKIFDI
ncbi:MAG: hypothetical protein MPK62_00030 [Alphaproteobacteria bacterium]|nr:hypothetical protein [Alphaproteobacteria bacterium]MDA8029524.1 hypothetical protein [Alphaproteobacteria bacterium]